MIETKPRLFLMGYKQFINRKMEVVIQFVSGKSEKEVIEKMTTFNAQNRLTTTEYFAVDVAKEMTEKGIKLSDFLDDTTEAPKDL